jgi:CelD/BcsL family acetyltransferase involved in cellulose biosynthesis
VQIHVARSPDELEPHIAAWESLAAAAIEPNVFFEPWMLLPAWRAFGTARSLRALLVYGPDGGFPDSGPTLFGFVMLERVPRAHGVPMSVLRTWSHSRGPLGTPLLRAGAAHEVIDAVLDWASVDEDGAAVVAFSDCAADGPFHDALTETLRRRGAAVFAAETHTRALLERASSADAVLAAAHLSPSHRRDLGRQRRRLQERGQLELRALQPGADPRDWIAQFLELERSGWKGREGTAFACDPASRAYFEAIATAAHARGRLLVLGLYLDGRPIAMKVNLLAPPGSFGYKIAFDEDLARYSPGVLLELDNIAAIHARPGIDWCDSCATEGHFSERLWNGRRRLTTTLASTGRGAGRSVVATIAKAVPVYRTIRRLITRQPDVATAGGT